MATDYAAHLKMIPLFASLSEPELAYISSIVQPVRYSSDQVVFEYGAESDKFYLIDTGQVRVRRRDDSGAETIVRFLGPGQFIGEVGLLRNEPRNATIETVVETTLFSISKDNFTAMLGRVSSVKKLLEAAAGPREVPLGRFGWQEQDEVTVWVAHRNIMPLIFESVGGLTLGLGTALVAAVIAFYLQQRGLLSSTQQWVLLAAATALFSLTWIWYIVDWTNDYLVVTNRRIVHVERYGLIRETREEIPVQVVQDVIIQRKGPLAAVLGLATITVTSIGGKLTFTHAPNPEYIQELILDQRTRVQHESRREEDKAIRGRLLKVLVPTSLVRPPELPHLVPSTQNALVLVPAPQTQPLEPQAVPSGAQPTAVRKSTWREWLHRLRPRTRVEESGEITWRKHWLVLVGRLVGPIFLLLAGPTASIALWLSRGRLERVFKYSPEAVLVPLLLIVPAFIWSLWEYRVWGGDIYILSTNRIVDIERLPFGLRETRRESTLDRIQDIDVNIPNLWSRIFDMGNVTIKTAGGGANFIFFSVAHPHSVQRDIFHRLAEFHRKEQEQQRRQRFDEMAKWLEVYNQLTTRVPAEDQESDQVW